jgi:mannosyltransferase OCH1-like enzyme
MVSAILIKGLPKIAKKGWKTLTTTMKHKGELRIKEINKKLKETPRHHQQDVAEDHAQEVFDIYEGKWKDKK